MTLAFFLMFLNKNAETIAVKTYIYAIGCHCCLTGWRYHQKQRLLASVAIYTIWLLRLPNYVPRYPVSRHRISTIAPAIAMSQATTEYKMLKPRNARLSRRREGARRAEEPGNEWWRCDQTAIGWTKRCRPPPPPVDIMRCLRDACVR